MTIKHTTRIAGAIIGSVAVIGALAACSDDEATDAQETSQVQSSDSMQSEAAEPTTPEAEQGQPMTGLPLAATAGNDVAEADISPAIAEAAAAYMGPEGIPAGAFVAAKEHNGATAVQYENVTFVEAEGTNGPQPLTGQIRETWVAGGALDNAIGLPTAPERVIDNGWEQPFTNDVMFWTIGENGEYAASYASQMEPMPAENPMPAETEGQ